MTKGSAPVTQTEKAYTALKKAILKGELPEGVFLSESDIMSRYEIGRTPYREACNRLHHEGLLEAVPHRGYLIREVSFQSVSDIFETRIVLEGAIAELAAVRASKQDIEELDRLAHTPVKPGAFSDLIQANLDFHLRLAATIHNRELVELLVRNLEKNERLMYIELRSWRFRNEEFETLHGRVVDALRKRDAKAAREAVLEDIMRAQSATLTLGKKTNVSAMGPVESTSADPHQTKPLLSANSAAPTQSSPSGRKEVSALKRRGVNREKRH